MTPLLLEATEDPRAQLERARAFVGRMLHQKKAMLVLLALGAVAAVLAYRYWPPSYRSQTVIVYSESTRVGEAEDAENQPRSTTVRLREILTSRQVLERVIDEFGLYPELTLAHGRLEAVEEMKKHVELKAPGGNTFTIEFDGRSPGEAQGVTKRLGELVIEADSGLRQQQAESSRNFLASEKKRVGESLKHAEEELASFMAQHPRFALDATPLQTGAAIRAMREPETRAAPPAPGSGPRFALVPARGSTTSEPVAQPSVADLETKRQQTADRERAEAALAAARADLAEKRARFTDAHPDVRAALESVERAQARVAGIGEPAPAAVSTTLAPAAADPKPKAPTPSRYVSVPVPRDRDSAAKPPSQSDVVELETDWARLTRAVTDARQKADQVEAALFRADIAASSSKKDGAGAQMTVIDPAYRPDRPVPPSPKLIAGGLVGVSLLLGILTAIGLAIVDDRIYDRRAAAGLAYVLVEAPRPRRRRRARG